ncbi:MAG: glutamate--tRNA ligase, partial [Atopobium sp.]|nr:glutamate--tRNA ligase [Atopobium sp.]
YDSDAFVNYLALLGWALDGQTTIIPRKVLAEQFSLDHVSKNPATFDQAKLDWINGEYLAAKTDADFAREVLIPQLIAAGLEKEDELAHPQAWYELLASILKPRTKLAPEVVEKSRFLYEGTNLSYDEKSVAKNLAKEGTLTYLQAAYNALAAIDAHEWTAATLDEALAPLPEQLEANKRKFYAAVRVAECGNQVSPPMGESLQLLGRDLALTRLEQSYKLAQA